MAQVISPTDRVILLQDDRLLTELAANTTVTVSSTYATWLKSNSSVRDAIHGDPNFIDP